MTGRHRALVVAAALGLGAAALAAQDAPQVFRGGVRTVPVYVTVNDRRGGFVTDLKQEDFEVRDDGVPQTITAFTKVAQPLSMITLIDGSSSMLQVLDTVVLEAANNLVLRMSPEDRMGIASFADIFQMRQPFTSDREALLKHLRDQFNIRVAGETRLWEALSESVLALSKETNRRVVIVLSDGKQWKQGQTATGQSTGRTYLSSAPGSLVSLALERDVMIYAIAVWTKYEGVLERPSGSIAALAAQTGGGFVEMQESDDIGRVTTQISKELHQQYVIGFTPQKLDGKVHKLEVKLPKTFTGLTVRARQSYVASKPESGAR